MFVVFFFQAEDGIRYLVRSRGLGDVYKRQALIKISDIIVGRKGNVGSILWLFNDFTQLTQFIFCLLYTSDAADERSSVDLGGRRIIKKKTSEKISCGHVQYKTIHK